MRKSPYDAIEERIQDLSTPEEFCFGMQCEQCGDTLCTTPVRFVKAGVKPESDGQKVIFETMYQCDKQSEHERAIKPLAGAFNFCPVCKRFVCNHCFVMTGDLDICSECAKKLGMSGNVVSDVLDEKREEPPRRINRISKAVSK